MTKNSLNFRYSDSNKSPNDKSQRRTSEIHERTKVAILDEFIEGEVFSESDWSEEDEDPVSTILILYIYKRAELTDDIIVSLSEYLNFFLQMIQSFAISKEKWHMIIS